MTRLAAVSQPTLKTPGSGGVIACWNRHNATERERGWRENTSLAPSRRQSRHRAQDSPFATRPGAPAFPTCCRLLPCVSCCTSVLSRGLTEPGQLVPLQERPGRHCQQQRHGDASPENAHHQTKRPGEAGARRATRRSRLSVRHCARVHHSAGTRGVLARARSVRGLKRTVASSLRRSRRR